jgi:hypothetical protein
VELASEKASSSTTLIDLTGGPVLDPVLHIVYRLTTVAEVSESADDKDLDDDTASGMSNFYGVPDFIGSAYAGKDCVDRYISVPVRSPRVADVSVADLEAKFVLNAALVDPLPLATQAPVQSRPLRSGGLTQAERQTAMMGHCETYCKQYLEYKVCREGMQGKGVLILNVLISTIFDADVNEGKLDLAQYIRVFRDYQVCEAILKDKLPTVENLPSRHELQKQLGESTKVQFDLGLQALAKNWSRREIRDVDVFSAVAAACTKDRPVLDVDYAMAHYLIQGLRHVGIVTSDFMERTEAKSYLAMAYEKVRAMAPGEARDSGSAEFATHIRCARRCHLGCRGSISNPGQNDGRPCYGCHSCGHGP